MPRTDPLIASELEHFRARVLAPDDASWHVQRLLLTIRDELFSPSLNVRSLTARCHTRDHNVTSRFKLEIGVGIKHYIESLRMQAARQLLAHGRFSAVEVAHAVGYSHLQTFYGAFRRHYECTPGDCRTVPHSHRAEQEPGGVSLDG